MPDTYDHWLHCLNEQRRERERRDRAFNFVLAAAALVVLDLASPGFASYALGGWSKTVTSNTALPIRAEYANSFLWFVFFCLSTRYFQIGVGVERRYPYIQDLETQLDKGGCSFVRGEGQEYLRRYPAFLNWIDLLFKRIVPIAFGILILLRSWSAIANPGVPSIVQAFDLAVSSCLAVTIVLYWTAMNSRAVPPAAIEEPNPGPSTKDGA